MRNDGVEAMYPLNAHGRVTVKTLDGSQNNYTHDVPGRSGAARQFVLVDHDV